MIKAISLTSRLRRGTTVLGMLLIASIASAQVLPSYYPDEGFSRTGRVDAILVEEQRIIVNDIPYQLASNLVVHAPNSYSVPLASLRLGATIGFRTAGSRQVAEIWILPRDYEPRRGR